MPIHDDRTIARFWAKVDIRGPDECWDWKAGRLAAGYGAFHLSYPRRRMMQSYKVAFEIAKGDRGKLWVLHTCDRQPCCNPAHLYLGTPKNNADDCKTRERRPRVVWFPAAKLQRDDVLEIRRLLDSGASSQTLATRYKVTERAIKDIQTGDTWSWVGTAAESADHWIKGENFSNPNPRPVAKITEADVVQIRKMLAEGVLQRDIAKQFGLHDSAVSRISTGKQWGWVA